MMYNVNLLPILLSGVSAMVVGFIWYGPLFGKTWMKLMGMKSAPKMDTNMQKTYGMMFVGSLVMAYVLSVVLGLSAAVGLSDAAMVAFWMWLGFIAPVQMTEVLFGGKSWNLYLINTGYQLVSLIVMAGVLVMF